MNIHLIIWARYTLLQVFSKFGKVTKLDYLFHKTGLLKGKPRGYAFIEYGNKDVSFRSFSSSFLLLVFGILRTTPRSHSVFHFSLHVGHFCDDERTVATTNCLLICQRSEGAIIFIPSSNKISMRGSYMLIDFTPMLRMPTRH